MGAVLKHEVCTYQFCAFSLLRFVCSGTVEERILTLQQRKLETARNVLEG